MNPEESSATNLQHSYPFLHQLSETTKLRLTKKKGSASKLLVEPLGGGLSRRYVETDSLRISCQSHASEPPAW